MNASDPPAHFSGEKCIPDGRLNPENEREGKKVRSLGREIQGVPELVSEDSLKKSKQMPPSFRFARSLSLGEGGRKEWADQTDNSAKLGWIAASAMMKGPRTRSARRPEQSPQGSAFPTTFCHGAEQQAGRLNVKLVSFPLVWDYDRRLEPSRPPDR